MSSARQIEVSLVSGAVHGVRLTDVVGTRPVTAAACGFTAREAEQSAHALLQILRALHLAAGNSAQPVPDAVPERLLGPGDFVPEADEREADDRDGPIVHAYGATGGLRYGVPGQVVLPLPTSPLLLEPTLVGAVHGPPGADLVGPAVAEILAKDIAVRWWQRPRPGLVRLPWHRLLPEEVCAGLAEHRLTVKAYTWAHLPFTVVLAVVHADGGAAAGFGVAAGQEPRAAMRTAFLRAQTARLTLRQASHEGGDHDGRLTVPHSTTRALAAWHSGPVHLDLLRRHSRGGGTVPEHAATDWIEQAHRRFGHEPLVASFTAPDGGRVVKVVCPGAAVYRPVSAAQPDCPL